MLARPGTRPFARSARPSRPFASLPASAPKYATQLSRRADGHHRAGDFGGVGPRLGGQGGARTLPCGDRRIGGGSRS